MSLVRNRTGLITVLVIVAATLLLSIPGFIAGEGAIRTPEERTAVADIAQEEGDEPFDLLVEDEDGSLMLSDEVTCDNLVDVLDAIASAEKLEDVGLLEAYGVEDTERREVAVEKLNALSRSAVCNPGLATSTPTASPTPTPTPTVTETTSPPPADEPVTDTAHFETWADVLVALPEGFEDSVEEHRNALGWGMENIQALATDRVKPDSIVIEFVGFSCGHITGTPGATGCPGPGETRTVLLPLGPGSRTGLVNSSPDEWALVESVF